LTLGRYAGTVAVVVGGTLALAWPLLDGARPAVGYGAALAAANTLAAYLLASWAFPRSNTVFLGAVLGGMVGRMGLMLLAVAAGVLLLGLPKGPLAVSVLAYFVVFLVFELAVLHRQTSVAREGR
jgi:hypothetical protein